MTEHAEQSAVFEWAALMSNRYPALQLLFAIPNAGKRSYGAAAWMRNEGLKKGVPDMFLPSVYRPGQGNDDEYILPNYAGLFIEMKAKPNKPTEEQAWWIEALNEEGYRAEVCYSADEAIRVICDYLGITDD